jgi:hypothetical protein
MKFNKKLARLESLYGVKSNKAMHTDPIYVSDFIHHIFENSEKFKLDNISKDWFKSLCNKTPDTASKMIKNILLESGFNVSTNCITEGIEIFKIDNE